MDISPKTKISYVSRVTDEIEAHHLNVGELTQRQEHRSQLLANYRQPSRTAIGRRHPETQRPKNAGLSSGQSEL